MSEVKRMSNAELKNVSGGTCTSGKTYKQLGIYPHSPQVWGNHPVITTLGNRCGGWSEGYMGDTFHDCNHCLHIFKDPWSLTCFCQLRSEERDDYK